MADVALRNPPSVSGIQPWYGSASGGTVVTLIGRWLNRAALRYVHYGDKHKWEAKALRYTTNLKTYRRRYPERNVVTVVPEFSRKWPGCSKGLAKESCQAGSRGRVPVEKPSAAEAYHKISLLKYSFLGEE